MQSVLPDEMLDDGTQFLVNPTGRFVCGGPAADSGLTGRKLIVDTYAAFAVSTGKSFLPQQLMEAFASAVIMLPQPGQT